MKVRIGPYPYSLSCDIHVNYMHKKYGPNWPKERTKFENLLETLEKVIQLFYTPINYFLDKRIQKVSVKLEHWDTWSMDHTLAYIVLPMLKQLKEDSHGAPFVEQEDVPEYLRDTEAEAAEYLKNGTSSAKYFKRWDWVMDEMIYAFDCKVNKDDVFMRFEDKEEMKAEQERISNGFILFGKYYECLWS